MIQPIDPDMLRSQQEHQPTSVQSSTSVEHNPQTIRRMNLKIKILFIAFLVGFFLVILKLFMVQVMRGEFYQDIARKQYEAKVMLAAERGNVYDRKNRLLATTIQKVSIAVDPNMVENPDRVCQVLSEVTGTPAEVYSKKIRTAQGSFVWLERAITSPASVLTSLLDTLQDDGLIKVYEPRRSFAYSSRASQILGFTDLDNNGASGIELGWDSILAGKGGYMFLQRDGRGKKRPAPDLPMLAPRPGASLILTLDMDMQSIVENELKQGVDAADAESGIAIAIRPATGEVLAMASYPVFDPNNLSTATPELTRNRGFTDMYEPGSTFKLVTAAALLEEGKIRPNDLVSGNAELDGKRDWRAVIKDDHPIGTVTFTRAMEYSSNVVMATLVPRLSNAKFYKYARDFGFGIYLGLDVPGEARGTVKRPHEFEPTTKMYMASGYELSATPLQILNAYATVANGGVMMKPFLVQKIMSTSGEELQTFPPQRIRRVISDSTAQKLTKILCGVVERGTGSSARIPGLSIAGKTGTAQQIKDGKYSKEDYTASFAGYFPAEKPEVAMIVMLNKPRRGYYGGYVSAPIFQRIAQKFVSSGLVSVDNAAAIASAKTTTTDADSSNADDSFFSFKWAQKKDSAQLNVSAAKVQVPDIRGMDIATAQETLEKAQLVLQAEPALGIVKDQKPKPGTVLKVGSTVNATTTRPDPLADATRLKSTIPDVRGMTVRRAITVLHAANIKTKVVGNGGVVIHQEFRDGKEPVCILQCEK